MGHQPSFYLEFPGRRTVTSGKSLAISWLNLSSFSGIEIEFTLYKSTRAIEFTKILDTSRYAGESMVMQHYWSLILVTFLCVSISGCANSNTAKEDHWDRAFNSATKERFIPVELFTGGTWDGKHVLALEEVSTTACATVSGRDRPCDEYYITGPFETETNDTEIEWAGDEVSYYRRIFSIRGGKVESRFTINNSRDGLVRIYDKRKQWGVRTYNGLGSKFPLGYWKQGEVRSYASRIPIRIEIIELDGPNHCLTFRWVIGRGQGRNDDNNYTFCPDRGFTNVRHNNDDLD